MRQQKGLNPFHLTVFSRQAITFMPQYRGHLRLP